MAHQGLTSRHLGDRAQEGPLEALTLPAGSTTAGGRRQSRTDGLYAVVVDSSLGRKVSYIPSDVKPRHHHAATSSSKTTGASLQGPE